MTSDVSVDLSASLSRAYVEHSIEPQPNGDLVLVVHNGPRLVLEWLCGAQASVLLARQRRDALGARISLPSDEAASITALVGEKYPPR